MSVETVNQRTCDSWSCPNFMQNICVFICLLKDMEGILSIHAVVSAGSTKSLGTDS